MGNAVAQGGGGARSHPGQGDQEKEGQRLLRIVRRSSGSLVTWRRAQMVLLSAQEMDLGQIAKATFTSEDRVRAVLHNFTTTP